MSISPSHLIFLVGIVIYLSIRAVFQVRCASQPKLIRKSNARERLLVVLVGAGQVGLPLIQFFTTWLNGANYTLPPETIWVGTPVMLGGLWLFWRSHTDLGNCWSVTLELNHNHRLVTQGVYRFIRHPMYASFFIFAISQALLLHNWVAGWAALAAVTLLYVVRIPHEEKMMLDSFGEEYRTYMRHTGGVIPRVTSARVA